MPPSPTQSQSTTLSRYRCSADATNVAARLCGGRHWQPHAKAQIRRRSPNRQTGRRRRAVGQTKPAAAARLDAARAALTEVSQRVRVPTENLVSPDLVRRLCWEWEDISQSSPDPIAAVEAYLRTGQARAWQLELVVPILTAALTGAPDAGAQGDDGS